MEEVSTQVTDIFACKNVRGKAVAVDLCGEARAPRGACNSTEEKFANVLHDGCSSGHISTSPVQNPEQSCVSEMLKIHSTSNDGNTFYPAGSNQNGRWELNEANSVTRQWVLPSSEEITNSMTSAESDMHEGNSLQGNFMRQSGAGDVSETVRQARNVEVGGLSLALEAVSGPSESDNHLRREEPVLSFNDASHSENVGLLHVDTSGRLTQSGESLSFAQGEGSGREARRINRRRLLDALTRATSRRRTLFGTFVVASEDINGSGSWNDSWDLVDWSSMVDEAGFADDGDMYMGRSLELEERRWRVRPQVLALQRLRNGLEGGSGRSRLCASGRHPDGGCFCEEFVMTEESNTRASISRIVMLAEALFELLDEIHHQSAALSRSTSLSLISSPAPAAVVEAFPLRIYKKTEKTVGAFEEAAQCYICLIEYEDGDRVRTLPCHHEYHMFCVDKWLKEVHRVCPLCRGNVCDTSPGNSVSS